MHLGLEAPHRLAVAAGLQAQLRCPDHAQQPHDDGSNRERTQQCEPDGDAFELNLAGAGYGDILKQTYRGSLSHLPVAPEPFRLEDPQVVTSQILGQSSSVVLEWEKADDPDAFDEVKYLLFIDKDKNLVERAIRLVERDMDGFLQSSLADSLLIVAMVQNTYYPTNIVEGGIYH